MAVNTSVDLASIRRALECPRPRCACRRPPRGSKQAVLTHCPAHDDQHPSLTIGHSVDGKLLVHCHAGCPGTAVLEALRSRGVLDKDDRRRTMDDGRSAVPSDQCPVTSPSDRSSTVDRPSTSGGSERLVATYGYTDESDNLLYQVVRYEPKRFVQRRPDPDRPGRWLYNLEGVRRVLYRLSDVLIGGCFCETFIVEGEKDADRLARLGLVATTCPGGAGKWRDEYTATLRDMEVVVVPDNDAVGRQHARQVARSLHGVAAWVRILELPGLPPKGDVSDWLDAGHRAEELVELAKAAPLYDDAMMRCGDDAIGDAADPQPSTLDPQPFALTDYGNAERLALRHGADLRYCEEWNRWLAYDGTRWRTDTTGEVMRRAKETVRAIPEEADGSANEEQRVLITRHARSSESGRRLQTMIGLAESERLVPVSADELDTHPWLLNCANGTLDLKSGDLREHRREDLLSKVVRAAYRPTAECPHWRSFLDRVLPDADLRLFVQKALGYSLSGDISERVMFILWGTGRNGKSLLLETVRWVLGDYAVRCARDTLMSRQYAGGIPNDLARLKGARFALASEAEEGSRLAEATIKEITGGDTITARFMRAEWFDFQPEFKLWFSTNHKPRIRGTDQAIWDRIRLIPFTVRIPDEEMVPRWQMAESFQAEADGILAWMLDGSRLRQREGLGSPSAVAAAVQEYRTEMDTLGQFIDERCVVGPAYKVAAGELYAAYKEWCEQSGERWMTQNELGRKLTERGFTLRLRNHRSHRYGLGLVSGEERDLSMTPAAPAP